MNALTVWAGVTIVYTALAMWATQPSYSCEPIEEPHAALYLDRETDREHLSRHAGRIQQLARRHAVHLRNSSAEADNFQRCLGRLIHELAAAHKVSVAQVVTALPKAE
jgi:hypothetical protein